MSTVRHPTIRQTLDLSPRKLAAIIGSWPGAALLESGPGFGDPGRWSILAARPRMVFESFGTAWELRREDNGVVTESGATNSLNALARWLRDLEIDNRSHETLETSACPFRSGLIGFFGYDLAPCLERLPRKAKRDSGFPDIRFGLYDTAIIIDHQTGEVTLQAEDILDEGFSALEDRCQSWREALVSPPTRRLKRSRISDFQAHFTKDDYLQEVRRAISYIEAGDIFQVNLSQRFDGLGSIDALDLYLRLKETSPAPFSGFYRCDDLALVSASPEWFYATRGDKIATRPIKGTRPRGSTPAEDVALAAELLASPKDRAELTMIIDLERNDLGRVCQYGTVSVTDPLTVESFAQVHHLVATIEGELRPEVTPIDVVRAMFPGGSITGAPKIRAMEIIDELEPTRRSLYTGALGYFSRGGTSAFNILIRSLLVEGERVRYQVGGGIVADSDPLAEYHETLHKGRGIRQVLEG